MKAEIITVEVKLRFEPIDEPTAIKKWWVGHRVEDAIEEAMPSINRQIGNVDVSLESVHVKEDE